MYQEYWQLVAKTLIETLFLNDNMWYIPNNSDSGNHTWYSDNMSSIPSFQSLTLYVISLLGQWNSLNNTKHCNRECW